MSHSGTRDRESHDSPTGRNAHTRAAAPAQRDAAADQLRLLLLLAADWSNNDRTHAREIASLTASLTSAQGPPVNVDVPLVTQTGNMLSCTMGNWTGEPTGYAYSWHNDGVANGATDPMYSIQPDDSGHGLACGVAATNVNGTTTVMSNAIAVS